MAKTVDLLPALHYQKRNFKTIQSGLILKSLHRCIKDGRNKSPGWFFTKHFDEKHIRWQEALLYVRALLAEKCREDGDLASIIDKAISPHENPFTVDESWLQNEVFLTVWEKGQENIRERQRVQPLLLKQVCNGLNDPKLYLNYLQAQSKEETSQQKRGWNLDHFYSQKQFKTSQTLELIFMRFQVLLFIGFKGDKFEKEKETMALVETDIEDVLGYAWDTKFTRHKPDRDMKDFFEKAMRTTLVTAVPRERRRFLKAFRRGTDKENISYQPQSWARKPTEATPRKTRSKAAKSDSPTNTPKQVATQSPTNLTTPAKNTDTSRAHRLMSSASKLVRSKFKRRRKGRSSDEAGDEQDDNPTKSPPPPAIPFNNRLHPRRLNVAAQDESNNTATDTAQRSVTIGDVDGTSCLPSSNSSNESPDCLLVSKQPDPSCSSPYAQLFADDSDGDFNNMDNWDTGSDISSPEGSSVQQAVDQPAPNLQVELLENRRVERLVRVKHSRPGIYDDEDASVDGVLDQEEAAVDLANETATNKNARKVFENVLHLAAVGSETVAATAKAILTNSMTNDEVTKALKDSGYGKMKVEKIIARKKALNEMRKQRAAAKNKGETPTLVEETTNKTYDRPLSNQHARARSQRMWTDYLAQGKDIPKVEAYSKLKKDNVDALVKWVVGTCQFRPGKTRNVRFRQEQVTLKNLPVYLRYGSFQSLFSNYKEAVNKESRVGERNFRLILKAITLKGTYNQGLSYYYVDFMDMIKLLETMFTRIKTILKDHSVDSAKKAAIDDWLTKAKENTKRSSDYLRHQYYADIRQTSKDAWTCAKFALGDSSCKSANFGSGSRLCLALSNHFFIIYVVHLVLRALPADDLERNSGELKKELESMVDLAVLSSEEMLYYAKHLMRGWWQDNIVNELKRLLVECETLKGIIMDHKNKLLPRSKMEAMSACFSKAGISTFGAMIFWAAKKKNKEGKMIDGIEVWFLDIVMNNTTAQEARDLMPCIEAIRSEFSKPHMVKKCGNTECFFMISDNALVNAEHSPFITAMNSQAEASCSNVDGETIESMESSDVMNSSKVNEESASQHVRGHSQQQKVADGEPIRESLRQDFSHRLGKWHGSDPSIVKWITFEAQRGKTQLDTHFAYVNKQLAKACLFGGIDYLDPATVFEALIHKGGSRATTTLLLDETESASVMCDECAAFMNQRPAGTTSKSKKLRDGIASVHDITFCSNKAIHRNFSTLDTQQKVIPIPTNSCPKCDRQKPLGRVILRHDNDKDPVFFAFKESLKANQSTETTKAKRDPRLLSTKIHGALMRHSSGMDVESTESVSEAQSTVLSDADTSALSNLEQILNNEGNLIEELIASCNNDCSLEFPIQLKHNWAKKQKRKSKLSTEVILELKRMFEEGQGQSQKHLRYTAERAVQELHGGMLKARWDQRLLVTISRVKSYFGRRHQSDQKEKDPAKQKEAKEELEAKAKTIARERAQQLLEECDECEKQLGYTPQTFEQLTLRDFHKIRAPLLRAFIKCRLLKDAASTEWDKMPNKGSLADNQKGNKCPRTGQHLLGRWAYELRMKPRIAKLDDDACMKEDRDLSLFDSGLNNEEPTQLVEFMNECNEDALDQLKHGDDGIEEVPDDEELESNQHDEDERLQSNSDSDDGASAASEEEDGESDD